MKFHAVFALSFSTILWSVDGSLRGLGKEDEKKKDSVCKDLSGALFGLCNAYCVAMECHDGPKNSNACEKVLANYERKRGPDDPPMPCLAPEIECPCWTPEELYSYPTPSADSFCARDINQCNSGYGGYGNYNWDGVRGEDPRFTAETVECGTGIAEIRRPSCFLYLEGVTEVRADAISAEEFAVCEQQINEYIDFLGLNCVTSDDCGGLTCPP